MSETETQVQPVSPSVEERLALLEKTLGEMTVAVTDLSVMLAVQALLGSLKPTDPMNAMAFHLTLAQHCQMVAGLMTRVADSIEPARPDTALAVKAMRQTAARFAEMQRETERKITIEYESVFGVKP